MNKISIANRPHEDRDLTIATTDMTADYPLLHAHWRLDADGKLVSFWHADKH